jgi:hypothetical protein
MLRRSVLADEGDDRDDQVQRNPDQREAFGMAVGICHNEARGTDKAVMDDEVLR